MGYIASTTNAVGITWLRVVFIVILTIAYVPVGQNFGQVIYECCELPQPVGCECQPAAPSATFGQWGESAVTHRREHIDTNGNGVEDPEDTFKDHFKFISKPMEAATNIIHKPCVPGNICETYEVGWGQRIWLWDYCVERRDLPGGVAVEHAEAYGLRLDCDAPWDYKVAGQPVACPWYPLNELPAGQPTHGPLACDGQLSVAMTDAPSVGWAAVKTPTSQSYISAAGVEIDFDQLALRDDDGEFIVLGHRLSGGDFGWVLNIQPDDWPTMLDEIVAKTRDPKSIFTYSNSIYNDTWTTGCCLIDIDCADPSFNEHLTFTGDTGPCL